MNAISAMFAMNGIPPHRGGVEDVVSGHIVADSARKRTGQDTKPIAASRCNQATRRRSPRMDNAFPLMVNLGGT